MIHPHSNALYVELLARSQEQELGRLILVGFDFSDL